MSKNFSILYLVLIFNSIIAYSQADKTYPSKESRKQFYSQLATKYNSKSIQEIWKSDTKFTFDEYVDGKAEKDLIKDYSTVIHELLHGYNQTENDGHTYFIENGIRIHVPFTDVYNSKELNKVVRKSLQDSIFRYGLYVGGKSDLPGLGHVKGINDSKKNEVMSIQLGIYGLLEEFSAYYFGDLAAYELYDYYLAKFPKSDKDSWASYYDEAKSDLVAYYEFQFFIATYLTYAKEKHQNMYADFHKNKHLKVVYSLIQDKYERLGQKIDAKFLENADNVEVNELFNLDFSGSDDDLIRFLEMAGMEAEDIYEIKTSKVNGKTVSTKKIILDEEDLKDIKAEYSELAKQMNKQQDSQELMYFGNFDLQIEFLKKQITPKLQDELNKLKIVGVTSSNYTDFLK
ncbi:MAG: hypothetical protein V4622_02895 [Bacteroidota bacterium]